MENSEEKITIKKYTFDHGTKDFITKYHMYLIPSFYYGNLLLPTKWRVHVIQQLESRFIFDNIEFMSSIFVSCQFKIKAWNKNNRDDTNKDNKNKSINPSKKEKPNECVIKVP